MQQRQTNLYRIFILIFSIVILLAILKAIFWSRPASPTDRLNEFALRTNMRAPLMLDSFTRFDSAIVLPGDKFEYNYTILRLPKYQIDTTFIMNEVKQTFINNLKTDSGFADLKANTKEILACYYDRSGDLFYKYSITPAEFK